jgi:uncharacterized protein
MLAREGAATMTKSRLSAQPIDLQPLEDFLMSERAPDEGMDISTLDGFLTGIAIGPEPVRPSEWLPLVWGDDDPVFDDGEEAQRIVSLIMLRYNEILATLQREPAAYAPILWEDSGGEIIATWWAEGFLDAVGLRGDAWMPLIADEEAGVWIKPIVFAGNEEECREELGVDHERAEAMLGEIPDLLPACVVGIDGFWKARRGASPATRVGTGHKTGRNVPCPCGSGRKYKRCCGNQ